MGKLSRRLPHVMAPQGGASRPRGDLVEDLRRRRARLAALEGALASMVRDAGVESATAVSGLRRADVPERGEAWESRCETLSLEAQIGAIDVGRIFEVDQRLLAQLSLTPALEHCPIDRALFLDTETTGLGGGTGNLAFLVGAAYAVVGGVRLEQLFLWDPGGELRMLERVRELLAGASVVVSFNGKSFDMPVLRARFVMNGLAPPPDRPHLDLLHLARRVHKGRAWRKTLAVIEREVLRFRRGPDVGGEEVAQRYRHYLRTGDDAGLDEVATHNARDVWSLVGLTAFYGARFDQRRATLQADDLPWAARTVRRAGDLPRAAALADLAVARGAGVEALRARAEIAKAAGELDRALAAYEAVAAFASDPSVRLELAKLYEHHRRDPVRALTMVEQGVAETDVARERRRLRLVAKSARAGGLDARLDDQAGS
jgi:uncharacterized protein